MTTRPHSSRRRSALDTLAFVAALSCVGLGACQNGSGSRSGRGNGDTSQASGSGAGSTVDPASRLGKDRSERCFRVDALISDWDAAQQDGDEVRTETLAKKIGEETDGDFETFAAAAKGDYGVRVQYLAVKALGFSRNPRATGLLVMRLSSGDTDLVANALISIKLRADPSTSLAPLISLMRAKDPNARRFASLAFANVVLARERTGRPIEESYVSEALTGLVGLVQDRDPIVRLHSAKAMGALRRPEANDFLVLLLKDEHVRIRLAAAAALERIGDARPFPEVVALLDHVSAEQKPIVREILVSYAERLQRVPLTDAQKAALGESPRAWDLWFSERLTKQAPAGRAPGTPPPPVPAPAPLPPSPDAGPKAP